MASGNKLYEKSQKHAAHQKNVESAIAAGVDPRFIGEQIHNIYNGLMDNKDEFKALMDAWETQKGSGKYRQVSDLQNAEHQWDPNKFLPGVQQQSGAIYDPRNAQLEALRQLQQSQSQEARAQTKEDFAQRMEAEEEAINRRGAWYSGGAIRNEQGIRDEQMRTLERQDLQSMAGQQELLSQQGALGYERSQFESQALFNNEASAYGRWKDERDYNYMFDTNERNFAVNALRSGMDADRFAMQFGLSAGQFQLQQDQFKEDTRRWNEEFAWNKFMYKQMQQ